MKILAVADTVHELVYSPVAATRFKDVDLIVSCGDLPFDYMEFIVSVLNKPLLYVFGNHNAVQRRFGHEDIKVEPEGGTNLHGRVVRQNGLLIGGLEGSIRYRPGPHQYSDLGMRLQMWRMVPRLLWNRMVHGRALDILVTHAPPRGVHDCEDLCHQGFPALHWFIRLFKPRYLLHGHTHVYRLDAERITRVGETEVINSYGYQLIDVAPPPRRGRGSGAARADATEQRAGRVMNDDGGSVSGELRALVDGAREGLYGLAQRLVSKASLSGQEREVADLVQAEMLALGYHDVWRDEIGNVVGRVRGGDGLTTCLNAHMDIVDPGDVSRWEHGPFDGEISAGRLWGRGATDTKGALAAQVCAGGLMCQAGLVPAGDVYVAAVVGEEAGGFGMQHLLTWLHPDLAVIGEPSGNALRRGHRGRFDLVLTWRGRSGHASAPERAINPYYSMARFLLALQEAPMAQHPDFGASTAAPTLSRIDQTSSNVIPSELVVHLDWRNVPGETLEQAQALVDRLLAETCDPGVVATAAPAKRPVVSYTGLVRTPLSAFSSFVVAPDDPRLLHAQQVAECALGRALDVGVWKFTTDGGHLSTAGVWCLGFGPGEEWLAHVVDEYVALEQVSEATLGYLGLAMELGRREI